MEEWQIEDLHCLKEELTNPPREPLPQLTIEEIAPQPMADPVRRPQPKLTDPEVFDG